MRILLFHDNTGPICWLANTEEQLSAAMRVMFRCIDTRGCYSSYPREFYRNFELAREGDNRQIRAILKMRNGKKGESWQILNAGDPLC